MRLSVVLVHYHTPELALRALASLQAAASGVGPVEMLVVDNGSDARGARLLEESGVRQLAPGANLGYAGAVNLGLRSTRGELVLFANADIEVASDCIELLVAALENGADVVGPRFYWDRGWSLLLPPAERRSVPAEALALLGRTRGPWARPARRRWRAHARRHWLARESLASFALSGALLAARRTAFDRVGELDEGYRLYFEETDWLARAEAAGQRSIYEPRARAVHLYDQSARQEPESRDWFRESWLRYRRRRYGAAGAALLRRLERLPLAPPPAARAGPELQVPEAAGAPSCWLELSPWPQGYPAVGVPDIRTGSSFRLPAEISERHPDLALWARSVGEDGSELSEPALLTAGRGLQEQAPATTEARAALAAPRG